MNKDELLSNAIAQLKIIISYEDDGRGDSYPDDSFGWKLWLKDTRKIIENYEYGESTESELTPYNENNGCDTCKYIDCDGKSPCKECGDGYPYDRYEKIEVLNS